jgi:hypothetical protein
MGLSECSQGRASILLALPGKGKEELALRVLQYTEDSATEVQQLKSIGSREEHWKTRYEDKGLWVCY